MVTIVKKKGIKSGIGRKAACRFIWHCVLCFGLLFSSLACAAENTVGVVMTGNIPYYKEIHKAFIEGLTDEGLFAGGKVDVVVQSPTPEIMAWTNAVRKLISIGSSVIVSYGAPATLVALNETSDIPVVFAGVYDPQALGIIGKNASGMSSKVPVASLIRNFRSIYGFSKLGVVFSDAEKDTVLQANEVKNLEGSFGFQSVRFNVRRAEDVSRISNVDALFLTTGCAAMHCLNNIIGVARKTKIPIAATIGGGEGAGVVLTIAANAHEQGREAARMAVRVLRGEKPSSIAPGQPRKVDMIINLKEATEMGLKVPFDLLTAATKVIK